MAAQAHDPAERGQQHQGYPDPLRHPGRHGDRLGQQEQQPDREDVAHGLVLQLAELRRVPQLQGPGEEPGRIDRQVQLGVGDDVAGV